MFSNHHKTKNKEEFLDREKSDNWFKEDYEGELSVDVFQSGDDIVIKSTIAGIRPEDVDITVNKDMVTIRGERHTTEEIAHDDYFFQECYWGGFSRSIILPQAVKTDKIKATLENGILTIVLPKAPIEEKIKVKIKNLKPTKEEAIENINR